MSSIPDCQDLYQKVRDAGFVCSKCGTCCLETEPGSNIVMIGPAEIRAIMAETGLSFDEVAEPYPDTIREGECKYTFAWAVKREEGRCMFYTGSGCSIYEVRPWICRTYPFMLDGGTVIISPCSGTGAQEASSGDSPSVKRIVKDLICRRNAETEEETQIAEILARVQIPAGQFVVIDSEGMKIING